jgi:hypothetical protein
MLTISSTSLMRGTLVKTIGSMVSSDALRMAKVLYLLLFVVTAPESRWPPCTFHCEEVCGMVLFLVVSVTKGTSKYFQYFQLA